MGAEHDAEVDRRIADARRRNPGDFERRDAVTGLPLPEPKPGEAGGRALHDLEEK